MSAGGVGSGCRGDERLSAYLDGDLPAAEAQAVRAHLETCVACRRAVSELGDLVGAARELNRPDPPPSLWPSIAGRLEAGDGGARPGLAGRVLGWRWPFAAGVLVGGAAVLLIAIGARPEAQRPPEVAAVASLAALDPLLEEAEAEFARAAAAYERSIAKLRALLEREQERWSDDELHRYAERLARLDEAITRSREAARRTPGDSAGNDRLFAAYQDKIAFLAAVVHRGRTDP